VGAVSSSGDSSRYAEEIKMIERLIGWMATVLIVVVVGTAVGMIIPIIIAGVPLWISVVAVMVVVLVLFTLVVWCIKHGGW